MQDKSYPESGSLLFDIICQSIQNDQMIDIDMTGVVSLPSMFLNASFGKAFSQFGVDSIKQKTKFSISAEPRPNALVNTFLVRKYKDLK